VPMQEGKLARGRFPPRWVDVARDELVLVQEGNLAHTIFPTWWDNVL
jgi:hypothetical protein